MIAKLLIANRGEIACRVARTARRLGIATVAVYSDADAAALHVEACDEAVRIGPAPARESYLDADAILDAARATGADAVHPGYGFLAENAAFADRCRDAGLVFVGPPADAIRAMGDKAAAIRAMREAGVPTLPGYAGEDGSDDALAGAAAGIGFPVIVKPSAGGGGKGMRIVREREALAEAIAGARREAASSFGSDALLVERYLERPRHVEVQVFADRRGAAVHLFERDCSVQRRHQKIVEEAPAPGVDEALREAMGDVAVRAALAIGYEGAGTVEFLLDPESGEFFFMEMNTRLQVEHPVTELVCGVDLVEWQLRVADGEPLPLAQAAIARSGHAFEARVYAEAPERGFLPAAGTLDTVEFPGAPARVDTGVRAGDAVGVHYDPMIAKVIVGGPDRASALAALRDAIAASTVRGVATNLDLLGRVAAHADFARGGVDTGFVERHVDTLAPAGAAPDDVLVLAALRATGEARDGSPWDRLRGWRLNAGARERLDVESGSERLTVFVERGDEGCRVELPSGPVELAAVRVDGDRVLARRGAHALQATARRAGDDIVVTLPSGRWTVRAAQEAEHARDEDPGAGHLTAPMPGTVTAVSVEAGARVEKGQALVVIEAMKMEHTIRAPAAGVVDAVHFRAGDLVAEGAELVAMTPDEGDAAAQG